MRGVLGTLSAQFSHSELRTFAMVPPPFDWALLLVRFGLLAADSSPSADAALASLAYLTAHPGTALERPAAGQELCIAPPPENDPYWNP